MNDIIVGIDIGTSKVSTIAGIIAVDGSIEIIGRGISNCDGIKKGLIVDIESVSDAIRASVKQAEIMSNIQIKSAFVNISSEHSEYAENFIKIPIEENSEYIKRGDLERVSDIIKENIVLPFDKQIIDVIPLEYELNGFAGIKDPVGMKGNELKVKSLAVMGKSIVVNNIQRVMDVVKIKIDGIIVESLACAEAILLQEENEQGVIAIDVGGSITNVYVFKENEIVFQSKVSIGGENITKDLSIGLKVSIYEAEKIKREYGLSIKEYLNSDQQLTVFNMAKEKKDIEVREIAEIIEARAYEIIKLAFEAFRNSGIKRSTINSVVLHGAGISYVDGVGDYASKVFEMLVRTPSYKGLDTLQPEFLQAYGIVKYVSSQERFKNFCRKDENGLDTKESNISVKSLIMNGMKKIFLK